MIHYHGGPITPNEVAVSTWRGRHAMISFAYPHQIELAAEVAQSFALDNGAFTYWKQGESVDVDAYCEWVEKWAGHPGFDFCLIPDLIEGSEEENDALISGWTERAQVEPAFCVPVWHLHESIKRLVKLCMTHCRVALGSSGEFSDPGSEAWWKRMSEAMDEICPDGIPVVKLHGLRMLNPTIFSQLPLSSADSTNVARNIGLDVKWDCGRFTPKTPQVRSAIMIERIESHGSAATWQKTSGVQCNLELIG